MSGEHWPPGASWPNTGRSPRQEAERLVAAALAAASIAARSTAGFATGAAECCVCPVCRTLAAMRDPSPEFAERLATGVGDLAVGLASILRAFAPSGEDDQAFARPGADDGAETAGAAAGDRGETTPDAVPDRRSETHPETPGQRRDPDRWPSARGAGGADGDVGTDPWQAATRALKTPAPATKPVPGQPTAPVAKPVAKKAVRRPAGAGGAGPASAGPAGAGGGATVGA